MIPTSVTYGVIWKSTQHPHDWYVHAGWAEDMLEMIEPYNQIIQSPDCIQACIVMRTESFQTLKASTPVVMEDTPNEQPNV